jgi:hypothetical protein
VERQNEFGEIVEAVAAEGVANNFLQDTQNVSSAMRSEHINAHSQLACPLHRDEGLSDLPLRAFK